MMACMVSKQRVAALVAASVFLAANRHAALFLSDALHHVPMHSSSFMMHSLHACHPAATCCQPR